MSPRNQKRRPASRPRPKKKQPKAPPPATARRKGNNKVPLELTIEREIEAWELHKQGFSQVEIAALLTGQDPRHPIGRQGISKALRRVEERLMADLADRVERHKVSHYHRCEGLYFMAIKAFRESKGLKGSVRGRLTITRIGKTNEPGDPRFIGEARDALRDMRKIYGIDAPQKFDGTLKTERVLEDLDHDELMKEHALVQQRIAEQLREKRKS